LCLVKNINYVPQTKFGRHLVFAPFLIIMALKRSLWDILYLLSFLLLWLPNEVCETYCFCSVSYYVTPTAVGWRIAILRFFFTIITSPRLQTKFGDLLFLHRFFLLLLLLLLSPQTRCTQVLEFSKWLPLPWKPWIYIKIF